MYGRTGATLACHVETIKQSYKNTEAVKLIIAHRAVSVFIIRGVPLVSPCYLVRKYRRSSCAPCTHYRTIVQNTEVTNCLIARRQICMYISRDVFFIVRYTFNWLVFSPPKSQQKHNTKYWRKRKLTTEWHICFPMRQFPGSSHSVGVSRDVPNFVYV